MEWRVSDNIMRKLNQLLAAVITYDITSTLSQLYNATRLNSTSAILIIWRRLKKGDLASRD